MSVWNKVIGIDKIISIFGEPISFHDAMVTNIKYDGLNACIEINCEGFIKTMSKFDEKYKNFKDANIEIIFQNISLFQIDGGYGFINELFIEKNNDVFVAIIESCGLKFICKQIEIKKVSVITKKGEEHNKLLDNFLKSNL
ncbi:MAG: Imm50 family immunity protein [Bacilli bacterium]|nr:Imm50 family immunity protein [Bacilli bacterium]